MNRITNTINHIDAVSEELDSLCQCFGLPLDSGVACVRAAAMARMANAERQAGRQPEPHTDPLIRAQFLSAQAVRLSQLYRARREVMGYNAQAEAIQNKALEILDDGVTAGRSWARFLDVQTGLTRRLERSPCVDVSDAVVEHAASDELEDRADLADLVSAPEINEAA